MTLPNLKYVSFTLEFKIIRRKTHRPIGLNTGQTFCYCSFSLVFLNDRLCYIEDNIKAVATKEQFTKSTLNIVL